MKSRISPKSGEHENSTWARQGDKRLGPSPLPLGLYRSHVRILHSSFFKGKVNDPQRHQRAASRWSSQLWRPPKILHAKRPQ
jgi:hypothetical protein